MLTNKLGILSNKEKIKKRVDFNNTESRIKECRQEWGDIRKKNIKDLLVEKYVIDMKKKHSLSIKQSKYLLSILFIAIVFKVISTEDIEYSKGKIQNINGIEFCNNKIIIKKNIYDISIDFSPETCTNKKVMGENWEKYLNTLRKQKTKLN